MHDTNTPDAFVPYMLASFFTVMITIWIKNKKQDDTFMDSPKTLARKKLDQRMRAETAVMDMNPNHFTRPRIFSFDKDGEPILVVG